MINGPQKGRRDHLYRFSGKTSAPIFKTKWVYFYRGSLKCAVKSKHLDEPYCPCNQRLQRTTRVTKFAHIFWLTLYNTNESVSLWLSADFNLKNALKPFSCHYFALIVLQNDLMVFLKRHLRIVDKKKGEPQISHKNWADFERGVRKKWGFGVNKPLFWN